MAPGTKGAGLGAVHLGDDGGLPRPPWPHLQWRRQSSPFLHTAAAPSPPAPLRAVSDRVRRRFAPLPPKAGVGWFPQPRLLFRGLPHAGALTCWGHLALDPQEPTGGAGALGRHTLRYLLLNGGVLLLHLLLLPGRVQSQLVQLQKGQEGSAQSLGFHAPAPEGSCPSPGLPGQVRRPCPSPTVLGQALPLPAFLRGGLESREPRGA